MSKKDKKYGQPVVQEAANPAPVAQVPGQAQAGPQDTPAAAPDVSKIYIFTFWGILVLAAAAAWILAIILPEVSESIIERWLMAALAASLAVFLLVCK